MMTRWIRKPAMLGLGLAATLVRRDRRLRRSGDRVRATPWSCPTAPGELGIAASPRPARRPAAGARGHGGSRRDAAGATPVKAEGWGTLKGQVVFGGDPPGPKVLARRARPPRTPRSAPRTPRSISERLVVDGATKGVKNVLVYIPKPTAVNDEAKKAAAHGRRSSSTRRSASSSRTSWA